jgi:hypothetical protein
VYVDLIEHSVLTLFCSCICIGICTQQYTVSLDFLYVFYDGSVQHYLQALSHNLWQYGELL